MEGNARQINEWIRRMQQSIKSMEKRIDAIERRLSGEEVESNFIERDDEEIERRIDEIEDKIKKLEEREVPIISLKKSREYEREIEDIKRKIERMRAYKITPLEITGLLGGFIFIATSILLFLGYKNFVSSPPFIAMIGFLLLIAVVIRNIMGKNV